MPESEATTIYEIKLDKLPHLRHLTDEEHRDFCEGLCDEISTEARQRFGPSYTPPGPRKLRQVDPRTIPDTLAKSPAPLVHCSDKEARKSFRKEYRRFVAAYQIAHHALKDALRAGHPIRVDFPPGCIEPTGLLGD